MASRKDVEQVAQRAGLSVRTWSPGDGVTRYRFFLDPKNGYFGPDNGIYTALGAKEAITFAEGYARNSRKQEN